MLKRYQVLLPDWLEEYVIHIAERFDLSFSEIIRAQICLSVLLGMQYYHPEYKPAINLEQIFTSEFAQAPEDVDRAEAHRRISQLYHETRKAVEYRLSREKKKRNF